ncbi:MAG: right-handed parallel beta-helix repeat-containing protein, partial [Bacteroidetes bacterium]|nr:right-handed parallel beta-helix repeat-containing protein [Bacteroidota bacterium]
IQVVYTAAELNAQSISGACIINQLGFYVMQIPVNNLPNYTIKMGNVVQADVSTAIPAASLSQVHNILLYAPTAGNYDMFTLQTPFSWDGISNVGVEICWDQVQPGFNSSGQTRTYNVANGFRYSWTDAVGSSCGETPGIITSDKPQIQFNFLCSPCVAPPTGGTTASNITAACAGQNINLSVTGSSTGLGITYQWQSSLNNINWINIAGGNTANISTTQQDTTYYRRTITCSGQSDTSVAAMVIGLGSLPAGAYTIGPAGDYADFTAASAALNCGIAGPVVFNVIPNSGPYNEQITITQVFNSSTTNTVLFNGNGNTITFAPTSADRHIIKLDGASYVAFSNLNVVSTDPTNGVGFTFVNDANYNIINGCNIDLSAAFGAAFSTTSVGIQISGNASGPTTAGNSGNFNSIVNTTIKGGYYGITIVGPSSTVNAFNNTINNCNIEDSYFYGIYMSNASNTNILNSEISRPLRPNVSTFYGVFHTAGGSNNLIEGNKFHSPFDQAQSGTNAAYGIYHSNVKAAAGSENKVINNTFFNFNNNGTTYGIYNFASDSIHYLHNTISLDHAASTGGIARGFHQSGVANGIVFRNNIVSITKGGTGTKYCLYLGSTGTGVETNNNVLHLDAPAGTNHHGYYSGNHTTFANWQAANSSAFDQNSVTFAPQFIDANQGILYPLNSAINNLGVPLGVTTDITGASRSLTTPDIGAFEFSPVNKDVELNGLFSALEPCFDNNDTLKVRVINIATTTLDFSQDTLQINWSITGASTASGTTSVNAGTLPGGDTLFVNLT